MNASGTFRNKLFSGKPVFGIVLKTPETAIAELAGLTGFDFAWIDMEHSSLSFREAESLVIALENQECAALIRVAENSPNLIGQALDAGANLIVVPHIDTPEDAEKVVRSAKYYPRGRRGFSSGNRITRQGLDKLDVALMAKENARNIVIAQIESKIAVENVSRIAAVDGIDVLFLGLGDLSQDLGVPGEYRHPFLRNQVEQFSKAVRPTGKILATIAPDPNDLEEYVRLGFRLFTCGTDIGLLGNALRAQLDNIRLKLQL